MCPAMFLRAPLSVEAQGDVAEAQRLARRHIIGEDDYQYVAKLIEATAERVTIPTDKQSPFA